MYVFFKSNVNYLSLLQMCFCFNVGTYEQREVVGWKSNQRTGKPKNQQTYASDP